MRHWELNSFHLVDCHTGYQLVLGDHLATCSAIDKNKITNHSVSSPVHIAYHAASVTDTVPKIAARPVSKIRCNSLLASIRIWLSLLSTD